MNAHPENASEAAPTQVTATAAAEKQQTTTPKAASDVTQPNPDNWWTQAACRGQDTNLFIPEGRGEGQLAYAITRTICETCPVKQPCLRYALDNGEEFGMWGGTTPQERQEIGYTPRGVCRICNSRFVRHNMQQRYCSDDCRDLRRRVST